MRLSVVTVSQREGERNAVEGQSSLFLWCPLADEGPSYIVIMVAFPAFQFRDIKVKVGSSGLLTNAFYALQGIMKGLLSFSSLVFHAHTPVTSAGIID